MCKNIHPFFCCFRKILIKQKISQTINNRFPLISLDILNDMRMMPDNDIRTTFYKFFSYIFLSDIMESLVFCSSMDANNIFVSLLVVTYNIVTISREIVTISIIEVIGMERSFDSANSFCSNIVAMDPFEMKESCIVDIVFF